MSLQFQNQFIVDDVSKIIKEGIESTIGGNAYQHVSYSGKKDDIRE